MELYKERDFGALLSDSFLFFKKNGKNYFKNYFIINGGLLLLLILLIGVGFKDIVSQLFGSNMQNKSYYFEQYFQENEILLILVSLMIIILILIVGLINYAYPILYLKMVGTQKRSNFEVAEIVAELRKNIGKIVIFMLFSIFIMMPLMFVVFGLNILLIILIIGFFLLFITFPAIINIFNFTLFDYLFTENGIFNSFGNAFKIQFSKNFWKYVGATLVVYIIIQVATSFITMIPMIFGGAGAFFNPKGMDSTLVIIMSVTYVVALLISLIASNLVYVVGGLMYFDSRKDLHQIEHFKEIDSIGQR
ncbi:MAG: hypothetical protein KGV44_01240 [Flavobacteriaceae bacterium]|nr:hypothetical protein [Flavobacteriaceae bacterium]